MHISQFSSKQLWILSAFIPFFFAVFYVLIFLLSESFYVDISSVIDSPVVAFLSQTFLFPGVLFSAPFGLFFLFLWPSSSFAFSFVFIFIPLISFLIYTCVIRFILDFSLKFFYEKK